MHQPTALCQKSFCVQWNSPALPWSTKSSLIYQNDGVGEEVTGGLKPRLVKLDPNLGRAARGGNREGQRRPWTWAPRAVSQSLLPWADWAWARQSICTHLWSALCPTGCSQPSFPPLPFLQPSSCLRFSCSLFFHQLLRSRWHFPEVYCSLQLQDPVLHPHLPALPHPAAWSTEHGAHQPLNQRGHWAPWSALGHQESHWPTWPETNPQNPCGREGQRSSPQGRFREDGGELVTGSDT